MHDMPAVAVGDGEIGGKARGLVRLAEALRSMGDAPHDIPDGSRVALPETTFVTTAAYREFLTRNGLAESLCGASFMDGVREEAVVFVR